MASKNLRTTHSRFAVVSGIAIGTRVAISTSPTNITLGLTLGVLGTVAITFGSVVASTVRGASTGLVTGRAKLVGVAVVAIGAVKVRVLTRVLTVTITIGRVQTDTILSVTGASGTSWASMSDSTFVTINSE